MCVCIDQFLWRIITFKNLFNHSTIQSYSCRVDQSISWTINEPFILWNKHQAVSKKLSKSTDPSIHPSSIHNKKLINWSIHPSQHPSISTSIHSSIRSLIHPLAEFGTWEECSSAIFVKFYTSGCVQLSRCVCWIWYLGKNVDWLQLLSLTPVWAFSLADVSGLSAEFGTPWEECWSVTVIKFNIVWGAGGEGVLAKFDTLGGKLIGHSP